MSIFDRVTSLAGTEWAKASNLAHETFQARVGEHRHTGRALVETVATICRNHPNLVGIAAGFLVERMLVEEKHRHDAHVAAAGGNGDHASFPAPPVVEHPHIKGAHLPHLDLKLGQIKPGKVGWEVFGGLILLKLAATGAKIFRHKHQGEVWFAPAARIHLFSGTIAAYQFAKALREPRVSAWRNGMILFFGTDALKPILNPRRGKVVAAQRPAAPALRMAPVAEPAAAPAPVETPHVPSYAQTAWGQPAYAHVEPARAEPAPAAPALGTGYVTAPIVVGVPSAPAEHAADTAQPGAVH